MRISSTALRDAKEEPSGLRRQNWLLAHCLVVKEPGHSNTPAGARRAPPGGSRNGSTGLERVNSATRTLPSRLIGRHRGRLDPEANRSTTLGGASRSAIHSVFQGHDSMTGTTTVGWGPGPPRSVEDRGHHGRLSDAVGGALRSSPGAPSAFEGSLPSRYDDQSSRPPRP